MNRHLRRSYFKKLKIFLDLDGVVADFYTLLAEWFEVQHWKDIKTREEVLDRLKGTDFFSQIPMFDNTLLIFQIVDHYSNGDWHILSTPLEGDFENSVKHKNLWLDKVLKKAGVEPKSRLYTHEKWRYAEPNSVLIDDRPQNGEDFVKKSKSHLDKLLGKLPEGDRVSEFIRFQNNESYLSKLIHKLEVLTK